MSSKKEAVYLIAIVILLGLCGQFYYTYRYTPLREREIRVHYNRNIQANLEIVKTIQEADKFVYFAIYTFTRNDIKDALLGAKHRGLNVQGITDREQVEKIDNQKKIIKELRDAGIPVAEQDHTAIMHIKTLVTDKAYVTGSYNWTSAATNLNDEILEIGRDENVRKQYETVILDVLSRYQKN